MEPIGPVEEDPNLTDKKFPGNPTKSYRSRDPLLVTGKLTNWEGHAPDVLQGMKDNLERLKQLGRSRQSTTDVHHASASVRRTQVRCCQDLRNDNAE